VCVRGFEDSSRGIAAAAHERAAARAVRRREEWSEPAGRLSPTPSVATTSVSVGSSTKVHRKRGCGEDAKHRRGRHKVPNATVVGKREGHVVTCEA